MRNKCETCVYFDYKHSKCHIDPPRIIGQEQLGIKTVPIWSTILTDKDAVACKNYVADENDGDFNLDLHKEGG